MILTRCVKQFGQEFALREGGGWSTAVTLRWDSDGMGFLPPSLFLKYLHGVCRKIFSLLKLSLNVLYQHPHPDNLPVRFTPCLPRNGHTLEQSENCFVTLL